MPSIEHYINLIDRNPYCLIAEREGNVEGFLTAADDKKILYLSSLEKDVVLEKMLTFNKPFIYRTNCTKKFKYFFRSKSSNFFNGQIIGFIKLK